METFIGHIAIFPFDFAPRGWALCNGQLLPINQNPALFSLLGTQFGGNGTTNFALPNLQGRAPMHFTPSGSPPGLTAVQMGQTVGVEIVVLTTANLPQHIHTVPATQGIPCSTAAGTTGTPSGAVPAVSTRPLYAEQATGNLGVGVSGAAGVGQSHPNMQPYLVLNYCICLQGIFPSRT
jgi:microcystin-dependent protein